MNKSHSVIDSRCGLHCTGCSYKDSQRCGGCIETMGNPFHGECPVANCCQEKGFSHCGQCDIMPCEKLYAFSYLDPLHGDKPPGARVEVLRRWAAESGIHAYKNVLLTSAGWTDKRTGKVNESILRCFLRMLKKPPEDAKVLFITTAAIDKEAKTALGFCRNDLYAARIPEDGITDYDLDGNMTAVKAMQYVVIYFTGGNTGYLLRRIKETGFDAVIRKMVNANKVYVGVSAGSVIAARDISTALCTDLSPDINGLCLINAYISVHCPEGTQPRTDLPLPHIPLTDNQALAVGWAGYELIGGSPENP